MDVNGEGWATGVLIPVAQETTVGNSAAAHPTAEGDSISDPGNQGSLITCPKGLFTNITSYNSHAKIVRRITPAQIHFHLPLYLGTPPWLEKEDIDTRFYLEYKSVII